MEFKNGDIVKVISLNEECLVIGYAKDIRLKEKRYVVYVHDGQSVYIVDGNDMIFIDTLEHTQQIFFLLI